MPKSYTIKQYYYLEAPPETVFEGLAEPLSLVRWFLSRAKVEAKKGGPYSFDWLGGYHMTGRVKSLRETTRSPTLGMTSFLAERRWKPWRRSRCPRRARGLVKIP
jgi:hypothetical protein